MESRMTKTQEAKARRVKAMVATTLSLALLATTGCTKLAARNDLNKGVQAYKAGRYEKAVEHFRKASETDPELTVAKLYLATACVAQFVPGGEGAENESMAKCAEEQYRSVLTKEPKNVLSTKGLASLYFNKKQFEEAKEMNRKAIELDPKDPENYYSVAVIDWTQSYVPRMEKRGELGLKLDEPIKDKKVCAQVKEKNEAKVQEGIEMLTKAIELRKDYDDAMAYLNLMYRERADIQCDDPAARAADLALADEWVQKTMDTKKAKAEKAKQQTGIVLDSNE